MRCCKLSCSRQEPNVLTVHIKDYTLEVPLDEAGFAISKVGSVASSATWASLSTQESGVPRVGYRIFCSSSEFWREQVTPQLWPP